MFGADGLVIIVLALSVAATLYVVARVGVLSGVTRTVVRSFWCPFRARHVSTEFQEQAWDGKSVAVTRCTAFTPDTAVACDRQCLGLRKFPSSSAKAA